MKTRFTPSLETLGERLTPSPLLPAEQTRQVSVVVDMSPESGDECLVFFLGGIPSGAAPEYVYGTELPDADAAVRHRLFSVVDRTQMATDGVVLLASSIPGGDAEAARRTLVTTLSMDLDTPAAPDPFAFAQDGKASGA
jgi:hypothetical protein